MRIAELKEYRATLKSSGFRGVFRKYGWKIFATFFAYYLIRDLLLYVLFPYLLAKGIV